MKYTDDQIADIGEEIIKELKTVFDPEIPVDIYELGLVYDVQISDEGAIVAICKEAVAESPKIVEEYKAGKERAIGAIVGLVMKKSKGKANPQMVNKILIDFLKQ